MPATQWRTWKSRNSEMPITQTISPITPTPDIADPATFETRANVLLTTSLPTMRNEINNFGVQANALGAQVQANADTWAGALGAANKWYPLASASDPTQRPDGSPVQEGDIYFNSTLAVFKSRFGGAWVVVNLNAAALAAAAGSSLVGFQQAGAGAPSRDLQAKGRETVSATDHGATGNGVSDDTAKIQSIVNLAAAFGFGVFFPAGTYRITSPIFVPSNSRIELARGAIVYNDRSNASGTYHAAWGIGNMHPAAFNYASAGTGGALKCSNISAALIGDVAFTLSTPSEASRFTPGNFVWVRTVAETTISGVQIPHFIHLTKVVSVVGAVVTVADPIPEDLVTGCLSPVDGTIDPFTGLAWSVAENVSISGGIYRTRNIPWTRSGMYRSSLKDMAIDDGSNAGPISVNCVVESKIENIHANFGSGLPMLEVKCGSRDSVFRDIWGTCVAGSGSAFEPVAVGEQSRDILLDNISCYVGANVSVGISMLALAGQRITVRNPHLSNLAAPSAAAGACIFVKGGNFGLYPTKDITIQNPVMEGRNLSRYIRIGDSTSTDTASNIYIRGIVRKGNAASVNDILYDKCSNVIVEGYPEFFKNALGSAAVAPPIVYERNVSVNEFDLLSGTPALTAFASGRAKAWAMDAAAEEALYFLCPVPAKCALMSAMLQWVNLGAGAGDARWELAVVLCAAGGDLSAGAVTGSFTQTASAQSVLVNGSEQRFSISSEIVSVLLRLTRKATDAADTLANDAGVVGLKLKFY